MAEDYYPFDSGPGANSAQGRWARMARLWAPSGVVGPPNTTDYQLTFNGLTATVSYPAGDDAEAWVRGFAHRLHTSPWSQPVPANSASAPLIERIVARRDLAAQTVTLMRLRGNPATNPTPPTLLREEDGKWDLPLWQYRVPGGSGTVITNIMDERAWINPGGGAPPAFASIAARDVHFPAPSAGTICTVAGLTHTHDGTAWRWLRKGFLDASTDGGGNLVIPHGLGAAPLGAFFTPGPQYSDLLNRIIAIKFTGSDAANIVAFCTRTDNSAVLPNQAVRLSWEAYT